MPTYSNAQAKIKVAGFKNPENLGIQPINSKNFKFSKTIFATRFLRLWRMFPTRVKKFSEISKKKMIQNLLINLSKLYN